MYDVGKFVLQVVFALNASVWVCEIDLIDSFRLPWRYLCVTIREVCGQRFLVMTTSGRLNLFVLLTTEGILEFIVSWSLTLVFPCASDFRMVLVSPVLLYMNYPCNVIEYSSDSHSARKSSPRKLVTWLIPLSDFYIKRIYSFSKGVLFFGLSLKTRGHPIICICRFF